ncbi:MAG TPA: adaptor protein MecA [Lachnospiraceae bacterium]|nr:adaptor protein MecA [Lachnospiraceae bacterium]
MKIERIDDNSIRCTLTSLDLSSRNINLRDMTYGSEAAKRLFTEMMQKAQTEVGFSADNGPLMIEAVPLQGGSIQLVISKVDDPEELDTRFSKFSQLGSSQSGWISQLASEILEGAQDLIKELKENREQNNAVTNGVEALDATDFSGADKDAVGDNSDNVMKQEDVVRVYVFKSLDRVIDAATAVGDLYQGVNTLYKNSKDGVFYLVLHSGEGGTGALNRASNLLNEFGSKLKDNDLYEAFFREHYDVIVDSDAIQRLRNI